ncbi:hypothetical protein HAX54_003712, partial [Datura stramonium]|nr:hypothetical protein [Datura stramonium]
GRAPHACCSIGKAAPRACHRTVSAPHRALSRTHRALSRTGRTAPHAWNRIAQGLRCASSNAVRAVPRTSGCAEV